MADISNILSSTKVALEKQAADTFGAAVDDFFRGSLPGPVTPEIDTLARAQKEPSTWYSSSYAAALASGTNYRPKLKFLFKVDLKFKEGVLDSLGDLIDPKTRGKINRNEFTFMIKSVDRPKVDFEYEDDINMYNFRTKALKKIRHRELTMTFMDDVGNRVFDFFRVIMMLYSPITRRQITRDGTDEAPTSISVESASGMLFSTPDTNYQDRAHRGVIDTRVGGALEYIRVKQMFIDPSVHNTVDSARYVSFDFMNPRVINFDLDDVTHEDSAANLLTMQFDYDWMEMVKVDTMYSAPAPTYDISAKGITGAPVDVLNGSDPASTVRNVATPIPRAESANPFLAIIGRQAQRAAQKITSDAVNRAVKNIAGRGVFGQAVASTIGNTLGGVSSGIVGAASRDLISGVSAAQGAYTTSIRPVVSDSTTAGADAANIKSSTNPGPLGP